MKRCWDEQELIEHWTFIAAERGLLANRTERGSIGVAVLLKFFRLNGRFPLHQKDVPGPVLAFIGEQLSVPPTAWFDYDLKGRSSQRDREQIRAFLSGGLDSSIIVALARPHVDQLHTFSVGIEGSRDLEAARAVARRLDTVHHEHVLKPKEVAACLQEILFLLESFDQDLVRSAIPCYFTARLASQEVKIILTGAGADELFAGYHYHRDFEDLVVLRRELRRSVQSLHNINFQRVDRMTMAHSVEGRVPFLDLEMIDLAQTIPPELKLDDPEHGARFRTFLQRELQSFLIREDDRALFADLLEADQAGTGEASP